MIICKCTWKGHTKNADNAFQRGLVHQLQNTNIHCNSYINTLRNTFKCIRLTNRLMCNCSQLALIVGCNLSLKLCLWQANFVIHNSVNAPCWLVDPTYGTVFLQQSTTLIVIQHLDELWSHHIYSSVLLLLNFLPVSTIDCCNAQSALFQFVWLVTLTLFLSFIYNNNNNNNNNYYYY